MEETSEHFLCVHGSCLLYTSVINRSYNLYSDVQRADDVVVTLPAKAGEKHFSPEQKVKLINPRITTDGYKIGERGFVNYILLADDMLPAESK